VINPTTDPMLTPIKLFLSSRTSPVFTGLDSTEYSLSNLRKYIANLFKEEKFFSQSLVEVIMHEKTFRGSFDKDVFNRCLAEVQESDIIVILYVGDAGWAPSENSLGICHEEYLAAVKDHPSMTFGIDLKGYFTSVKYQKAEKKRNDWFQADVDRYEKIMERPDAKTVEQLQNDIGELIQGFVMESLKRAFQAKRQMDASNTVFGKTLDWSKMSYTQRTDEIKRLSSEVFKNIFPDSICQYHAIPDHMSVSDARNSMGRPFLNEYAKIGESKLTKGVIHFITVYGNVTETQVKNLIGFPDLTLIKTPFGFYLWEQTTQIQFIISSKCINPGTIRTRGQQVINWLRSSLENDDVEIRAEARYSILKSIVAAREKTK
jgi:hypothetical protein